MKHLPTQYVQRFVGLIALVICLSILFLNAKVNNTIINLFCKWFVGFALTGSESVGSLLAAFALGLLAFIIRSSFYTRPLYAVAEVYFGIVGASIALLLLYKPELLPLDYQRFAPDGTKYPIYIGLGSSIYVIVRGLDNWFNWMSQPIPPLSLFRNRVH